METNLDFKRKIYEYLLKWDKNLNKLPLVIDGLRQVRKSYIVNKFAIENYENVITYDFRHNKSLRNIFDGDLDVNTIIRNSVPYFLDKKFVEHKTILIFEEIGDCPLARTSLKSFAMDKRFTVIATSSLLGVLNYRRRNKIDIPVGYEEIVHMNSLDFEEFLWANGVDETTTNELMNYATNKAHLPDALANFYSEMIKRYVVIGGMPASIIAFLTTNNYIESRKCLEGLINEYRGDFGRFINNKNEEEVDYSLQ